MERAIESLEKKEMSGTAAAELYNVPRSTLFDYLRYKKRRKEEGKGKEGGEENGEEKGEGEKGGRNEKGKGKGKE